MNHTFKVILVGDEGCGKSVLVTKFNENRFEKKYIPTLGVEVDPLRFENNVCLNIWDCSGNEKFRGLGDGYYVGAQGAILCFDLTSPNTLYNIQKWANEVKRMVENIPFVICGLKCDHPQRMSNDQIRQILGNLSYIEVSSKENINVREVFTTLINQLM